MRSSALKLAQSTTCQLSKRTYATGAYVAPPRHLMSMQDVSPDELDRLVRNALRLKKAVKVGNPADKFKLGLAGKTVALMFSKLSTRTRVSTEAAVTMMGGHPMFLGKNDIQLGVSASPPSAPMSAALRHQHSVRSHQETGQRVATGHFQGHLVHDLVHCGSCWSSL